jgi:subtilisin family serine protease
VAVVDSGVDYHHPELRPFLSRQPRGRDLSDDDDLPFDRASDQFPFHGTGVAGVIVAASSGTSEIVPIRFGADLADAVSAAVQLQPRIVQMSLSLNKEFWLGMETEYLDQVERLRQTVALHPEILFVVAAGNDYPGRSLEDFPQFPASFDFENVIVVGSVNRDGVKSSFSYFSMISVDLMAIGEDVPVLSPGGLRQKVSGTSFAAPQVAGLAAQLWYHHPRLSVSEVKDVILSTVQRRDELAPFCLSGGILDPKAALMKAASGL